MKKQYIFIIGAIACANTIASQDYSDGNVYIYKQNSVVDGFSSFDGVDAYSSSEIDSISFIDPCEDFSIDSFKFETGFKTYGWKKNAYFDNWEEQFTKSCYQHDISFSRERMFSDTSAYVYNAQDNAVYAKRTCDIMLKVYGKNVDRVQYLGDGSYSWNNNDYRWTNDNWYDEAICTRGEDENGQRTLIVRLQAERDMTKEEVTLCNSVDKAYIKGCSKPIATKALPKVYIEPVPAEYKQLCVSMCDNEFAVKTINLYGNNFLEGTGIEVYFWNEEDADYTAKATYEIKDLNHLKVYIPENAGENHPIYLKNKYNELYTDFIYRDTRNLLITHDDKDYLNLFNQNRPDEEYYDEYEDRVYSLPISKDVLKETVFKSENTNGDFSIFWNNNFTTWTYSPYGEANPEGIDPKYPTPFGIFSESIDNGETTFNDYVIKFEVFVPEEYPMNGNSLVIGFYGMDPFECREYSAIWQPSKVYWNKYEYIYWEYDRCDNWTSGGDWMTVTIPMEELRYNFMAKAYHCAPENDRKILDGSDDVYSAYGDNKNGLPFFDLYGDYAGKLMTKKVKPISGIAIIYDMYDEPNNDSEPLIAVDNLRIVPKDNNGGVWPMFNWGMPTREFNTAPVKCGKDFEEESGIKLPDCEITIRNTPVYPENPDTTPLPDPVVDKTKRTINGYEYVDLGLPSGNLWATVNVGASTPSEYGEYYAYGEIEPKKMYDENTSAVYGLSQELLSRKSVYNVKEDEYGMYEYVLSPKHDAATMNWGNGWQLPNGDDFEELFYECEWTWTNLDGVNGYVVKSKQKGNDNSIFLPAAGMKVKNGTARDGQWGRYLTENKIQNFGGGFDNDDQRISDLKFDKKNMYANYDRIIINGLSVRPVAKIK